MLSALAHTAAVTKAFTGALRAPVNGSSDARAIHADALPQPRRLGIDRPHQSPTLRLTLKLAFLIAALHPLTRWVVSFERSKGAKGLDPYIFHLLPMWQTDTETANCRSGERTVEGKAIGSTWACVDSTRSGRASAYLVRRRFRGCAVWGFYFQTDALSA